MRLYLVVAFIVIAAGLGVLALAINEPPLGPWELDRQSTPLAADLPAESGISVELKQAESGATVGVLKVKAANGAEIKPVVEHAIKILPVPFTPQAPYANWGMPYQEACEEASMQMVVEYFNGNHQAELLPDYADEKILELVTWEEANGFVVDLTAVEVTEVLAQRFGLAAEVVPYNSDVMRQAVARGQLIILPAAGRLLGNPYFTQPGPLYHMIVVKGYEGQEFIVNDPGTKRGLNYRYHENVLARAAHDWQGGDVENGEQVMIIVKGKIDNAGS